MAFDLMNLFGKGFLSHPGDEARARITKSGLKVATYKSGDGFHKYSRTEYPNGTRFVKDNFALL